ncbi:MAG: type II secretion system protein GspK [Planctomycetota bacterium]
MMRAHHESRQGFVLLAVVVVIAMLSLSAYTFTHWLSVEQDTAVADGRRVQARALADSGVSLVEVLALHQQRGTSIPDLQNNLELFSGMVVESPETEGVSTTDKEPKYARFAVFGSSFTEDSLVPTSPDKALVRFGLEREGGKIHLNAWFKRDPDALRQALLALPNATDELVDSVLDWLDPDDEKRTAGAEREDYEALQPPIVCRNGPVESIEELLLVRGMTREILFGEDVNRNGKLDLNEDDGDASPPFDDQDGTLNLGWYPYLTLYSRERNVDGFGRPRIYLNEPDLGRLYSAVLAEFGEEMARWVVAYRVVGPVGYSVVRVPPPGVENADFMGKFQFRSAMDLVDTSIQGNYEGESLSFPPLFQAADAPSMERFERVVDRFTASAEPELVGRLDLFSASEQALAVLKILPEEKRRMLIEQRPVTEVSSNDGGEESQPPLSLVWLLTKGIVTRDEWIALEPFVTARSPVVRFQSIGFFDGEGISSRQEVIMDMGLRPPRVLDQTNLDLLGPPVPLPLIGQGEEKRELPNLGNAAVR